MARFFPLLAKQKVKRCVPAAAGLAMLFLAFGLGALRLHRYPFIVKPEIKTVMDTRAGRIISLDHQGFLADLLFIRVVLHSGSLMWKPAYIDFDGKWAYRLMDVITDLDPRFYTAYLFAGMGLVHYHEDARLAIPILEKGMAVFPESWELPFWAGYLYLNRLDDPEKGARYLWQAHNVPGAPKHFVAIMTSALRSSGDFGLAARGMQALADRAANPNLKQLYLKKSLRLTNLDQLKKAAELFRVKTGRFPSNLDELVGQGVIKEIPRDPDGRTYAWDSTAQQPVVQ